MKKYDQFIGLQTVYPLADGGNRQRIHLDGAASPLVMQVARDAQDALLPHYSNSHSHAHASAHISANAMQWARQTLLDICGAKASDYSLVALGNGSTSIINAIARRLRARQDEKPIVLVSGMEHHANDLPHRQQGHEVIHIPLLGESDQAGEVDLVALELLLKEHAGNVNYVTVSGVSNVTGIINPIAEITALAHKYDALCVLDAAQMAAHMSLNISDLDVDFVAFSGHKVYCASSPGVLVAKTTLLRNYPSDEVGGGIVSHVSYHDAEYIDDYPAREQPGTKDLLGIYALATVMQELNTIGFDTVQEHSEYLWQHAFQDISKLEGITIYGNSDKPRIGALSFNLNNIDHGLVASILSDYFGIAVRNECFCAHPYVSSMIKESLWNLDLMDIPDEQQEAYINRKRGMVRASFSLYNTKSDIEELTTALRKIIKQINDYAKYYDVLEDGSYRHREFNIRWQDYV